MTITRAIFKAFYTEAVRLITLSRKVDPVKGRAVSLKIMNECNY